MGDGVALIGLPFVLTQVGYRWPPTLGRLVFAAEYTAMNGNGAARREVLGRVDGLIDNGDAIRPFTTG